MLSKIASQQWRGNLGAVLVVFLLGPKILLSQSAAQLPETKKLKLLAEIRVGTDKKMQFSPDGESLVTSRKEVSGFFSSEPGLHKDLIVWDVRSGEAKLKVADGCSGFAFSRDGKAFVVQTPKEVLAYDSKTGNLLATLNHPNVMDLQFVQGKSLLVTETRNWKGMEHIPSELRFWSTTTWERVETQIDQAMPLTLPAVSPDGKYAAGFEPVERGSRNMTLKLKIWDLETGKELPAPNEEINQAPSVFTPKIGFMPGGKELFKWGMLWDIEAAMAKPLPPSFHYHLDVEWPRRYGVHENKRAKIINGKIVVWDLLSGEQIARFTNPVSETPIDAIPHDNENSLTLTTIFDDALSLTNKTEETRAIDIFKMDDWKSAGTILLNDKEQAVDGEKWVFDPKSFCVRIAKDGKTVVVLEAEIDASAQKRRCKVTAYDSKTFERKYRLEGHCDFVSLICLSSDSQLIATGSGSDQHWAQRQGEVKLWDMASGKLVRTVVGNGGRIHCLAFNNRGGSLAIGRDVGEPLRNPEVSLWSTATGAKLYHLQLPPLKSYPDTLDNPHSLAFSPDDKLLAVGGLGQLSLWEMPSGKFRYIGQLHGPVDRLNFSDDGKKLYLRTGSVEVARISEQKIQQNRGVITETFQPVDQGRSNGAGDTAFSIPSRFIATCPPIWQTNSGEISLWDVERKQLHKVICHDGVQSIDFASTGVLVAASIRPSSNITRVLDHKTGREMARFGYSGQARFSPTGEMFAALRNVPRVINVTRNPQGYVIVEKTQPDGVVSGVVELWETRTGQKLSELQHDAVSQFEFAPDGKSIASFAGGDIKLWQISEPTRESAK
jgi:WD40 repeat protein